uniref:Capsid protein n=1 Tax=Betatorquevirus homini1 TaxID=3048395 RepID=A0AAU8H6A5_9VIRU
MPPFTYRRYWNFYRPRYYRRRWHQRRRPRKTLRRRFWRRRWVRRRRFIKYRKRKLKKIKLCQWQPDNIRKCHIKGQICLLTCGINRINNNFTLTAESFVPVGEPGGGGWSIMQITLRALFDEYQHYRNWWTTTNCGFPLVRYCGCRIKFYNSNDTDYIVTVQRTGPFEVTRDSYLNTQPSRHIMNKNSFVVPKLNPNKKRKPYIKKRYRPPALLQNKWYFAQDMLNTPLILFTISSASFDQMYAPNDQISTNITFNSLNTDLFQNPLWETDNNEPYYPKVTGTINEIGLYTFGNGDNINNQTNWKKLIPLYDTQHYKQPQHNNSTDYTNSYQQFIEHNKWGNPFSYSAHHEIQDIRIFYGKPPTNQTYNNPPSLSTITGLYQQCRYNPFKDKAIGNKVYIKSTKTQQGSFLSLPTDSRLLITDFPLWLIMWGWISWLEKSKPVHHLQEDYQLVFQSPYIYPPMKCYVPLDNYFTHSDGKELTETDKNHWHPKLEFQLETLSKFAETGPAAPKINKQKQLQIHAFYDFYFKWGGCPAPMETICDPAEQEKFPNPNNILQELAIENPETPKEHYIYRFDERDGLLTNTATKRLKKDTEPTKYFTEFGAKDPLLQIFPPTKTPEETTPEESEEEIKEQLQLLKQHRDHLRDRINRLTKRQKLFPTT